MTRFCSSSLRGCFEVVREGCSVCERLAKKSLRRRRTVWSKGQRMEHLSSYNSLVKKRKTPKGEADRLTKLKQVCFEDGTPVWGAFNSSSSQVELSKKVEAPKRPEGLLQWIKEVEVV